MILTCPSCSTQYVVKDGAIPPEGRQVRCAACKHSWHQNPEETDALELQDQVEPPAQVATEAPTEAEAQSEAQSEAEDRDEGDESLAEAALIEPRSGPEAEERAYEEALVEGETDAEAIPAPAAEPIPAHAEADEPAPVAAADWNAPPEPESGSDNFSPFAGEDEEMPPRSGAMRNILIAALVIIALAVAFWFLAPADMKARLGLASAAASPLQVSNPPHVERLQLASGNELLTVSGRVINPTSSEQQVPPLNARLTNQAGKLVYSWTIAPPTRSLPAGASASFNSAEVTVPPGGEYLTITLGRKA